jgi:hypothetical protein
MASPSAAPSLPSPPFPNPSPPLVTLSVRSSSTSLPVPFVPERCFSFSEGALQALSPSPVSLSDLPPRINRPGSGCTSFLKTLSNNIESFKSVEGEISYDGLSPEEMRKHHKGDAAYLPEDDHHLPHLTVGQTLTFASAARTPASDARVGSRKDAIDRKRDVLLSLFGLKHTINTKVGNDVVRGVSGGERKRVSIAELLTTGCKIGWCVSSSLFRLGETKLIHSLPTATTTPPVVSMLPPLSSTAVLSVSLPTSEASLPVRYRLFRFPA